MRRLVRAAGLAGVIVGAVLGMSGCWGIAPIAQRGMVLLMGIDRLPDAGYQVTAAILNPLGQPTVHGTTSQVQPEILRSATGSTVAGAIARLSATTYLSLDYAHTVGVVVSQAVASQGLVPALEVMQQSPELVTTPWLYVADGESAADVLRESAQILPSAGEVLAKTTLWTRAVTPNYAERLSTFFEHTLVAGDDPATVGLSVDTAQGVKDTLAFRLAGLAMFRGGRLVGWLRGPALLGWRAATGRAQQQTLVVQGPAGAPVTVQLLRDRRRVRVTSGPAGPRADIRVTLVARLTSLQSVPASGSWGPSAVPLIERQAAALLAGDAQAAVRDAQAAGSDIFSLGQSVRLQAPQAWNRLRAGWDTEAFRRLPVSVHVRLTIISVGNRFCPLIGPC